MLAAALVALRRLKLIIVPNVNVPLRSIIRRIALRDVFTLSVSGFCISAFQYIFRAQLAEIYGVEFLGNYQVAWMISNLVSMLITVLATSILLPKLSKDKVSNPDTYKTIGLHALLYLALMVSVGLWMLLFGDFTISVVSSKSFSSASNIFFQIILGDMIRCLLIPISFFFLSRRLPFLFVMPDLVYGAIICLMVLLQGNSFSSDNVVLFCHAAGTSLALITILFMFRVPYVRAALHSAQQG